MLWTLSHTTSHAFASDPRYSPGSISEASASIVGKKRSSSSMVPLRIPPFVVIRSDSGSHVLQEKARFVRLNVQAANEPYRQRFTTCETDDEWKPVHYIYVFREPAAHCWRYDVERAEEPHRTRLRCGRKPQSRDITEWQPGRGALTSFWAYPERAAPGVSEYAVDWTSAPDRYAVTTSERPDPGWRRCFRFFAFSATKYHVLERSWAPGSPLTTSYRVVAAHTCVVDESWTCSFAFFAFDRQLSCTNQYTVQSADADGCYDRIRVGMVPSERDGWRDERLVFYAHDVAVPGTARFNVQYRTRDGSNAEWEQNRISIDEGAGLWVDKFAFYAFPAPTVDLARPPRDEPSC